MECVGVFCLPPWIHSFLLYALLCALGSWPIWIAWRVSLALLDLAKRNSSKGAEGKKCELEMYFLNSLPMWLAEPSTSPPAIIRKPTPENLICSDQMARVPCSYQPRVPHWNWLLFLNPGRTFVDRLFSELSSDPQFECAASFLQAPWLMAIVNRSWMKEEWRMAFGLQDPKVHQVLPFQSVLPHTWPRQLGVFIPCGSSQELQNSGR